MRAFRVIRGAVAALATLTMACGGGSVTDPNRFSVRLLTQQTVSGHWERDAERGLGLLAAELDADVARVRVAEPAAAGPLLAGLSGAPVDLVICVGSGLAARLLLEAPAHPATAVVLLPGPAQEPNVAGIDFRLDGAGYVAGAVAARLGQTGRLGMVRGEGGPWLADLEDGFASGVAARAGAARLEVVDEEGGVQILAERGVSLALYAADEPRAEFVSAAAAAGIALVVTDPALLDRSAEVVVAAIRVDVAEALLRVAREVRDGGDVARIFAFDLGSDVVDVVLNSRLDDEARAAVGEDLERARAEVTAGIVEIEELGL